MATSTQRLIIMTIVINLVLGLGSIMYLSDENQTEHNNFINDYKDVGYAAEQNALTQTPDTGNTFEESTFLSTRGTGAGIFDWAGLLFIGLTPIQTNGTLLDQLISWIVAFFGVVSRGLFYLELYFIFKNKKTS